MTWAPVITLGVVAVVAIAAVVWFASREPKVVVIQTPHVGPKKTKKKRKRSHT